MLSCNSKVCVDVAIAPEINQVTRRRYAKPEWHKSQAKFIINLCIEKQQQQQQEATSSKGNNMVIFNEEGGFESRFGSRNATSSPDSYVWRQRFLRSYTFTREEDLGRRKKKMVVGLLLPSVLKKMWIKKVNVVNGIHKEGKKICGCCVDSCLRFLLCFFGQKFDVLD